MSAITIPRPVVASEEVADALHQGLGPRHHVLPRQGIKAVPVTGPGSRRSDTILVGTGSHSVFPAEVAISGKSGQTSLRATPGGMSGTCPGRRAVHQCTLDRQKGASPSMTQTVLGPAASACSRPLLHDGGVMGDSDGRP